MNEEEVRRKLEEEAAEKLEELEAWVKAQPPLTPEDIEAIAAEVDQKPEFVELNRQIKQGEAFLAYLESKK